MSWTSGKMFVRVENAAKLEDVACGLFGDGVNEVPVKNGQVFLITDKDYSGDVTGIATLGSPKSCYHVTNFPKWGSLFIHDDLKKGYISVFTDAPEEPSTSAEEVFGIDGPVQGQSERSIFKETVLTKLEALIAEVRAL